jgi:hypothetical protein
MKITGAAIHINGKMVTGSVLHASLWADAFSLGLLPKRHETEMTQDDWRTVWLEWGTQEGFVLDSGEFVDREQAAEIALGNGQVARDYISIPNELHVPDIF